MVSSPWPGRNIMAIPERMRTNPSPWRSIDKITELTVGGAPELSFRCSLRKTSSDSLPIPHGIRTRLRIKVTSEKTVSHPKRGSRNSVRAGMSGGKVMLILYTDKT